MTARIMADEKFVGAVMPRIPVRRFGEPSDFGGIHNARVPQQARGRARRNGCGIGDVADVGIDLAWALCGSSQPTSARKSTVRKPSARSAKLANDLAIDRVHICLTKRKWRQTMIGKVVLENVRQYRTIASLYRQTAAFRPDQKWSLLAHAFEYERLARTELERYFPVRDTALRREMAAAA
jgi:hypothetical protein